ncbi:hypothetical protein QC761_707130 [Podospora bellae-mahoneyi]|uniref:Uncharacterized protein n=1 Tax=Podospora bellae-mahoneyi TaxID=2093777 RepID=A0ABR0F9B8_9PEZI|nr:hypothetical protein QC761_707130 [Podospora bellae-mahoneyi]
MSEPPPPQPNQQPDQQQEDIEMLPAPEAQPQPPSQSQPEQPESQPDQQPPHSDPTSDPIPSDQLPPSSEPVIPGPRAQRLKQLFQQTTTHTLDKLSPSNFRECFPTIAEKAPGTLDNVHRQMIDRLSTLWNREFERILESRQVIQKLNELEGLIAEAQAGRRRDGRGGGRPVPPHTLGAEVVLKAHLRGYLREQETRLGERLQEVRGENGRLFEEVLAQRREMERLVKGVENMVGDVRGASEVLGGVLAGELEEETRRVDGELARVGGG